MIKVTAKVDGMMCGMCEAHIADAVRGKFPNAKKVSASRKRGEVNFLLEEELPLQMLSYELHDAIDPTGYELTGVEQEQYRKKGLFSR